MRRENRRIPHYDRRKKRWRVEFPDRAAEEGDLLYVAAEFARSGLYFPYQTSRTEGTGYSGHAHSFQGVIHALLDDPDGFSIAGFEDCYSEQEREFLAAIRGRLTEMNGAGTDRASGVSSAERMQK